MVGELADLRATGRGTRPRSRAAGGRDARRARRRAPPPLDGHLAATLPDCRVVDIDGARHFGPNTHPDAVAAVIMDLVAGTSAYPRRHDRRAPDRRCRHGLPSTVLPPADADCQQALAAAVAARRRRRAGCVGRRRRPRPALPGRVGGARRPRPRRRSSATRTTASATTADSTRCVPNGWRGSGYVRWCEPTNRGFLRALAGLGAMADAIGERDEAERIATFLVQLDPDGGPSSAMTAGAVLCGGAEPEDGHRQGAGRGRRCGDGERVADGVGAGGMPAGRARRWRRRPPRALRAAGRRRPSGRGRVRSAGC